MSGTIDMQEILIRAGIFFLADLLIVGTTMGYWARDRVLLRWFPQWEGTKKHIVCALLWGLSMLLNVPIYIGVAYALPYKVAQFMIGFGIFSVWCLITIAPIKIAKAKNGQKRREMGIYDLDNSELMEPLNKDNMKPPFF